jgi:multisubunit Na+/H+ antiporter MnhB subunit
MATETPVPFVVGLLVGVVAFAALVLLLVAESRRPVHFREPVPYGTPRPISHTRVAVIGLLFVAWSIWSTARPVSGWR